MKLASRMIFIFAFLILLALPSTALFAVPIQDLVPVANITVDGDPSDWVGVSVFTTDPSGDQACAPGCTTGDVGNVYLAKDNDYLFYRVDFWSAPQMDMRFIVSQRSSDRSIYVIVREGEATILYLPDGFGGNNEILYQGSGYGVIGTVAEGKIPLVALKENPYEKLRIIQLTTQGELVDQLYKYCFMAGHVEHQILCEGDTLRFTLGLWSGDFFRPFPDTVTDIKVYRPDGSVLFNMADLEYDADWVEYRATANEIPQTGEYTATVMVDGWTLNETAQHSVSRNIPLPDPAAMSPVAGTVLDATPFVFTWPLVDFNECPLYYRLRIVDQDGNTVFRSSRVADMTNIEVPENELEPGGSYRWRVEVMDHYESLEVENVAISEWAPFTLASEINPHGMIRGRVWTSVAGHADLSVTNAIIFLEGTGRQVNTDSQGQFLFTGIPSGTHTLRITAPHFDPVSMTVTLLRDQDLNLGNLDQLQPSTCNVPGDATNDDQLGLDDAVYILQCVSGKRGE